MRFELNCPGPAFGGNFLALTTFHKEGFLNPRISIRGAVPIKQADTKKGKR